MKPQNTLTENSQYAELVHWNGMTGAWKRFFVAHVDKCRGVCTLRILDRERECLKEVSMQIVRSAPPPGVCMAKRGRRYRFEPAEGTAVSREVAYAFKPMLMAVGMVPKGIFAKVRLWKE